MGSKKKRVELKTQASPARSQVSLKSNRSMDLPGNFLGGTIQDMAGGVGLLARGISPAPSHVSMKSDRSMDLPGNFLGGIKDMTRFPFQRFTPAPTHMSLKSESLMDLPGNGVTQAMTSDLSSTLLMEDHVRCSVCKNVLKDPVSIPCGHSYCRQCISSYWAQSNHAGLYACPQCSHTYSSCPALYTNSALAEVVHKLQHFSPVPPTQCYAAPGDVACDFCTGRKRRAVKSCLTCTASFCEPHGRQHYTVPALQRHTLVEICQKHHRALDMCRTAQCTVDGHHSHDISGIKVGHCKRELEDQHIGEKTCDSDPIVKDSQIKKSTVAIIAKKTKVKEESAEQMGKNTKLKIQHRKQGTKNSGLNTDHSDLLSKNNAFVLKKSKLIKKTNRLKAKKSRLIEVNGKLKTEYSRLMKENAELESESSKLKDRITTLERRKVDLTDVKRELEKNYHLESNCSILNEEYTDLKLRNTNLGVMSNEYEVKNSRLREQNGELLKNNSNMNAEHDQLVVNIAQQKAENSKNSDQKIKLQRQYTGLLTQKIELKTRISKLRKRNSWLRHCNSELVKDSLELSDEREKLETENDNLRNRNAYLMEETSRLREENTELNQMPGLKEEIAMLKSSLSMQKKKCTMLKRHLNSVIIGRPGLPANVTLDTYTSHCQFTISDDGKRMKYGRDDYESILDNRQRFDWLSFVVAKEGFTSGRHFWQVEVSKSWIIGVTKESACRKGLFTANAQNGYWCLHCSSHSLYILGSDSTADPVTIGYAPVELRLLFVCLDVNERWVSFYDAESWKHLHTFRDMVFRHGERIYPVFCCKDLDEEIRIKAI